MHLSPVITALTIACLGTAIANQGPPPLIRVSLQLVELPHPTLTELMAGPVTAAPALHDKVIALTESGKAQLVETCIITVRSGQKAALGSNREVIYPAEFEPSGLGSPPVQSMLLDGNFPLTIGRPFDSAFGTFETRYTGVSLEIEPSMGSTDKFVDLRIATDIVDPVDLVTWTEFRDQWGDASVRLPVFETWRHNLSVTLAKGRFTFINAFTPQPAAHAPAVTRKILCFIRADVLSP